MSEKTYMILLEEGTSKRVVMTGYMNHITERLEGMANGGRPHGKLTVVEVAREIPVEFKVSLKVVALLA